MTIFKTCDIRGVYGSELDKETAHRLGRAVGARMQSREVVVGGDLRISTPALKEALILGLLRGGAHVVDVGMVPTPAFYYAMRALGISAGVMVTASHNPARYNGFKLMLGALPIEPEELQELAREMQRDDLAEGQGNRRTADILPAYEVLLCDAFSGQHPRHVVVDAGNGAMWQTAPNVLRRLGHHVDEIHCVPDGTFPGRDPNPAVPAHLEDLRRRVRESGAELGIAFDGDGDRVIFVDEGGRVQPADRLLVLMIRHLLRQFPGAAVVYDLKSSSVVPEAIRTAGGRALIERSGHAFIKRRLLTEDAVLGGEVSGHYFFRETGGDDALYAILLMLRILDEAGATLGAAMDTVPEYPGTPDLRIPCPLDAARRILDELRQGLDRFPIDTLDGVRVRFDEGWALARVSVTEPLITLRFEAHTGEALRAIIARVRGASASLDDLMRSAGPALDQVLSDETDADLF
jgi:phosphomannomutase/phosphoglucomutase